MITSITDKVRSSQQIPQAIYKYRCIVFVKLYKNLLYSPGISSNRANYRNILLENQNSKKKKKEDINEYIILNAFVASKRYD